MSGPYVVLFGVPSSSDKNDVLLEITIGSSERSAAGRWKSASRDVGVNDEDFKQRRLRATTCDSEVMRWHERWAVGVARQLF
jgi:hypothetical protein